MVQVSWPNPFRRPRLLHDSVVHANGIRRQQNPRRSCTIEPESKDQIHKVLEQFEAHVIKFKALAVIERPRMAG